MVKYICHIFKINVNFKDNDGNLASYHQASESRRTVRADAKDMSALLPESVSSKHLQIMRHGSPRYRVRPLNWGSKVIPSYGGNQGGTANIIRP